MKSQLIALTPWLTTAQMTMTSTATADDRGDDGDPLGDPTDRVAPAQVAGRHQRLGRIEGLAGRGAHRIVPPAAPKRIPTQLASRLEATPITRSSAAQ